MTIHIVLADDHTILRQGLRALLEAEKDFHVVGEAGTGLETLKVLEKLRPDVLVLDLAMPELGGVEVVRQAQQYYPGLGIVILSMYIKESHVLEALKYRSCSYVKKGDESSELIKAIRMAARGERYLGAPVTEEDIENYIRRTQNQELDLYDTLTNREREILLMVVEGFSNSEIANRLIISPRTVETHRARVMHKLGLQNQAELIRFAVQRGLTPGSDGVGLGTGERTLLG